MTASSLCARTWTLQRVPHANIGEQTFRVPVHARARQFEVMMEALGRQAGRTYTPHQLRALFRRADKDKNKQLDFHEARLQSRTVGFPEIPFSALPCTSTLDFHEARAAPPFRPLFLLFFLL